MRPWEKKKIVSIFGANRDKKYPMPMVKYTAGSLMLWACFSARGRGCLVQIHGIMDAIKFQQNTFLAL